MENNKKLSVILAQSQYDKLEKIADKDGRSISGMVRLLIDNLVDGNITVSTVVENTNEEATGWGQTKFRK